MEINPKVSYVVSQDVKRDNSYFFTRVSFTDVMIFFAEYKGKVKSALIQVHLRINFQSLFFIGRQYVHSTWCETSKK